MILVLKQSRHGSTEFTPAMAESSGVLPSLSPVAGKPVHAAFDGGHLTSDAGVAAGRDRPAARDLRASGALHRGPARSRAHPPHAGGHGGFVLRQLRHGAAAHRAGHRRYRGPRPRRPAAPLFHAHDDGRCFLPMHIYEATAGKPVAVILRSGKTPDGAEVTLVLRHVVRAIPHPLAARRRPCASAAGGGRVGVAQGSSLRDHPGRP